MERSVVLIVEDDPLVRMQAADIVDAAGFHPVEAQSADHAITILEQRADIRAIFTDVEMPGSMDGVKLAHAVRNRWPPIAIITTSGLKISLDALPHGSRFVPKPYSLAEIARHLRELIDG